MDAGYIFSALLWGSIGFGFLMYGKKRKSLVPIVGGLLLMWAPYFQKTVVSQAIVSIVVIALIFFLKRRF